MNIVTIGKCRILVLREGNRDNGLKQVKLASKRLLDVLRREKLVLDWRKKQKARAEVFFTIETILDRLLPRIYTPELYREKCTIAYQHIYDSYYRVGKSVYDTAA